MLERLNKLTKDELINAIEDAVGALEHIDFYKEYTEKEVYKVIRELAQYEDEEN